MGSPTRTMPVNPRIIDRILAHIHTIAMLSDAEILARWRTIGARNSERVLELAPKVLKSGGLGEQGKFQLA